MHRIGAEFVISLMVGPTEFMQQTFIQEAEAIAYAVELRRGFLASGWTDAHTK